MTVAFGRPARALFALDEGATFLNHGSFGACPRDVLAEQERIRGGMEARPDEFFRAQVMPAATLSQDGGGVSPSPSALSRARAELAAFVGAEAGSIAFVENATVGVQCALRSMSFAAGDEILITDHTYNAVRLMVEARCAETGATARTVCITLPTTAEAIAEAIEASLDDRVKLAILDHITSPTALVFPLERIVPRLRARGIRVLVDGAHAVGQVDLDMSTLKPDWYVSNAHKWLFAPRGTALLHASREAASFTQPPVVSHFVGMGFPACFDWIGTRDYSPWLSVPAAIRFWKSMDAGAVRAHQRRLLAKCTELLAALGIEPIAPLEACAAMRSFVLAQSRPATPDDAHEVMRRCWDEERVQVMAVAFGGKLLLRVSAHVYVDPADLQRLAGALGRLGWPGR
ncbi:MAG TPA: aminotransferase class V-fold PLP-dependent enzyme [Usitatibacter sp.]|nr:aminotransferase class V-fold PLP-dependent enzyme [Usitatibacter sp.]